MKSKLILGTAQLGLKYGINNEFGKPSSYDSFKILNTAYDSGIKTLDTAESYGNSHKLIGSFIKKFNKKFKIITKFSEYTTEDDIETKLFDFLNQLNVDYIDTLMFHNYDLYYKSKKIIKKLIHFKSKGLIKKIGVSIYKNSEAIKIKNDTNIDVIQLPFNLLDNHKKRGDIINQLKSKNKIVHVRSVFLQGLFFVKDSESLIFLKLKKYIKKIQKIASSNNMDISTLALNYPYCYDNIDNLLIGTETNDQLLMNLKSLNLKISNSIFNEINLINVKNNDFLNPSLWKTI